MDYARRHFHSMALGGDIFLDTVLDVAREIGSAGSVLDIGCGAGQLLDAVLAGQQFSRCYGVDLSPANVAEATARLGKHTSQAAVDIVQGDYMQTAFEPVQLIVSSSTLHLIPVPAETLFAKIRDEVADGGYLVFSVPSCGWYNTILILLRRLLKTVDCKAVRSVVGTLGALLHPSVDKAALEERIPYMFIIPAFLFGMKEDTLLKTYGFTRILKKNMPFLLGKPKHALFVYEKI